MEDIWDPRCGLGIYGTESRETWIRCESSAALRGAIIGGVVIIIVVILLLFFGGFGTFGTVVTLLLAAALIAGGFANAIYLTPTFAGRDWDRFENKVRKVMAGGKHTWSEAAAVVQANDLTERSVAAQVQQAAAASRAANSQGLQVGMNALSMLGVGKR